MGDRLISVVDAALAALFWVPARLIGYEKCSRCTVRVRWYQLLLLLTAPAARVPAIRSRRVDWRVRVDRVPARGGLKRVSITDLEAS